MWEVSVTKSLKDLFIQGTLSSNIITRAQPPGNKMRIEQKSPPVCLSIAFKLCKNKQHASCSSRFTQEKKTKWQPPCTLFTNTRLFSPLSARNQENPTSPYFCSPFFLKRNRTTQKKQSYPKRWKGNSQRWLFFQGRPLFPFSPSFFFNFSSFYPSITNLANIFLSPFYIPTWGSLQNSAFETFLLAPATYRCNIEGPLWAGWYKKPLTWAAEMTNADAYDSGYAGAKWVRNSLGGSFDFPASGEE